MTRGVIVGSEIGSQLPPTPPGVRQGCSAPVQVVFDQSWNTKVFGMNFAVELCIALAEPGFEFQLGCNAGIPLRWSFAVHRDTCRRVDIGAGFHIEVAVTRWKPCASSVSFELALHVAPPFLAPIAFAHQPVMLPSRSIDRSLAAPTSPAELLAMLQMAPPGRSRRLEGALIAPTRDGVDRFTGLAGRESFAGGLFGCRYDRQMDAHVPPGFVRDHVEIVLDPPGSGVVYFVAWGDADPRVGQFTYHVECAALAAGHATFNLHCAREPGAGPPA